MKISYNSRIAITGGFGFIGSNLVRFLNQLGYNNITVIQDNWYGKWKNLVGLSYKCISRDDFIYNASGNNYDFIICLGANSSTSAQPSEEVWRSNYEEVVEIINKNPLSKIIFASSASVYGSEENDFSERVSGLKPLNFYAFTKLSVDKYILETNRDNVISLRFFNVYGGKEESHKGDMKSVIHKWLSPIYDASNFSLFKSLKKNFQDGMQYRDFIHVKDICKIIFHAMKSDSNGIFNAGTGNAVSYLELANKIAKKKGVENINIKYVDIPDVLKNQYQYSTKADIRKLRKILGFKDKMISIEDGIDLVYKDLINKE